jgi:flavin reductase (DIM6/NTAB) family NADH-FMN oxidoreductase RutF
MAKTVLKPGTLLAPVPPVLVSCGTVENPNVMTIGWTGIINTRPPMTYISVRPERYSYNLIKDAGEFVINIPTEKLVFAVDYCGVRSGKNVNKFEEMKLTAMPASQVKAPIIMECPLNIECKIRSSMLLGSHEMFIADIVAVNVDDSAFDKNGKIDFENFGLLAYAHGSYFGLGEQLGTFGFSVKKKKKGKDL